MSIDIRPIEPDKWEEFLRVAEGSFSSHPHPEDFEDARVDFEFDRSLAAFQDGRIVGTAAAYSFSLSVPGSRTTPAAGVTMVGVLPTARRQGIMRSLMRRQLDEIRERGEAIAILMASESLLYGRYGYGIATTQADFAIDPRFARFDRAPAMAGGVDLLAADEARKLLPDIFERARREEPGQIDRSPGHWEGWFRDRERWRRGASARFYAVYRSPAGSPDGYVTYRVRDKWEHGMPANTLIITDLMAVTSEASAALWQYCLSVDLMVTVEAHSRPVDEPVRWMLADPRKLRVAEMGDFLWARLLDISKALEARRYAVDGTLVFAVSDNVCPELSGTYRLTVADGRGCAERVDAGPDLAMSIADLGAAYLGGVRFSTLARAGRVEEKTAGALNRADVMFLSDRAPWCATGF